MNNRSKSCLGLFESLVGRKNFTKEKVAKADLGKPPFSKMVDINYITKKPLASECLTRGVELFDEKRNTKLLCVLGKDTVTGCKFIKAAVYRGEDVLNLGNILKITDENEIIHCEFLQQKGSVYDVANLSVFCKPYSLSDMVDFIDKISLKDKIASMA